MDKECALGGQSKDNSGGGGGGARDAKGLIAAKEKRARVNDVEGGGGATKKQGRKLPLKRNQPPSTSVDAVWGGVHQQQWPLGGHK